MKKTTLFVLAGLAVMIVIFYSAQQGQTPAVTLWNLVNWFFRTFPA